jgi:signal transduction histidine kinase
LISLVGYIIASIQLILQQSEFDLPNYWTNQVIILLVLSLVLSGSIPFIRNKILINILILIKAAILVLIGYPLGTYIGVELTICIVLIIEIMMYLPIYINLIESLVLISVIMLFQKSGIAWETVFVSPSPHDLVSFTFYSLLVTGLSFYLKIRYDRSKEKQDLEIYLKEASLKLSDANIKLQQFASIAEKDGIIGERKRITRDLHDTIGHTLTNIMMMVADASDLIKDKDKEAFSIMNNVREHAKRGLNETRNAIYNLHGLKEPELIGIKKVQNLVKVFSEATKVKIKVEYGNIPWTFKDDIDEIIFHFIQEGLTNAVRHGNAKKIKIFFWMEEKNLLITMEDNGKGSVGLTEGIGIKGMKERLSKINGNIEAKNISNGFSIHAIIPLEDKTDEENKNITS